MCYVLNQNGKPLMPTTRHGHVRHLLKDGKARVVSTKPFVIQLLYPTGNVVQPLILGIDPGRTNIGVAVVKEDGTSVLEAQLITRNKEVPKLMAQRKGFRSKHRNNGRRRKRVRRAEAAKTLSKKGVIERKLPGCEKHIYCIGIRNKEAKFNNRIRPEDWLTPTANHLLQTHLNLVRKLMKFLPISKAVLELNKFAFMALDNPNIQKWQYQRGPLYGFNGVKDAVSVLQDGHCLFCDKDIEHYHHIVPKSKHGSDTLPNLVGLCKEHHDLIHKDEAWAKKLAFAKAGLNKQYGALSVLNQIIPALTSRLSKMMSLTVTTGQSTAAFRKVNHLEKNHNADAYCIACSSLSNPADVQQNHSDPFLLRQFRRQDRQACIKENLNRVYLLEGKPVAVNRHKATSQTKDSLEEYVANGGRTDCLTVKKHNPIYKRMDRIMPGAVFKVGKDYKVMQASQGLKNGIPGYYIFTDGTRATPKQCQLVRRNVGLVFV